MDEEDDSSDKEEGSKEDLIMQAGHEFVILKGLWLRHGGKTFLMEYDSEWDEKQRFENGANKAQGQLRDIMEVLGTRFMAEPWVAKAVSL